MNKRNEFLARPRARALQRRSVVSGPVLMLMHAIMFMYVLIQLIAAQA